MWCVSFRLHAVVFTENFNLSKNEILDTYTMTLNLVPLVLFLIKSVLILPSNDGSLIIIKRLLCIWVISEKGRIPANLINLRQI